MDDELIDFSVCTGFRRAYDYLPYTANRIKRFLRENGMALENIYQGYKANRRPGYCELYRIVRMDTGEVIKKCVSLEQLRRMLAHMDVPLTDEKSMAGCPKDTSGWNPKARLFLEIVKHLSN